MLFKFSDCFATREIIALRVGSAIARKTSFGIISFYKYVSKCLLKSIGKYLLTQIFFRTEQFDSFWENSKGVDPNDSGFQKRMVVIIPLKSKAKPRIFFGRERIDNENGFVNILLKSEDKVNKKLQFRLIVVLTLNARLPF